MAIRITYNSVNVDLYIGPEGWQPVFGQKQSQNRSASGKVESINLYNFGEAVTFDASFQETVYRQLIAFWAWAEQGQAFSFAMDSGNVSNTTLDGAAASGQKTIPLTATTALTASDICFIRSADRTKYEIVVPATVNAGVSVVATDNLTYTYASGDLFRHWEYWPSLVLPEGETFNPRKDGSWYTHTFRFLENL